MGHKKLEQILCIEYVGLGKTQQHTPLTYPMEEGIAQKVQVRPRVCTDLMQTLVCA